MQASPTRPTPACNLTSVQPQGQPTIRTTPHVDALTLDGSVVDVGVLRGRVVAPDDAVLHLLQQRVRLDRQLSDRP
eukprot:1247228-Rhodomonas_salina.1